MRRHIPEASQLGVSSDVGMSSTRSASLNGWSRCRVAPCAAAASMPGRKLLFEMRHSSHCLVSDPKAGARRLQSGKRYPFVTWMSLIEPLQRGGTRSECSNPNAGWSPPAAGIHPSTWSARWKCQGFTVHYWRICVIRPNIDSRNCSTLDGYFAGRMVDPWTLVHVGGFFMSGRCLSPCSPWLPSSRRSFFFFRNPVIRGPAG